MIRRDVVTSAAKLALEIDTSWVKWMVVLLGCAALWTRIVVVVVKFAGTVIVPATDRVDEACWVEFVDDLGKAEFRVGCSILTPTFVVYDLCYANTSAIHFLSVLEFCNSPKQKSTYSSSAVQR